MSVLRKLFSPRSTVGRRSPSALFGEGSGVQVSVDELIQLRLKARGIDLRAQRILTSTLAGGHGSRFRGRGMDYQESRQYQPGDDIRNMDWRVTARVGRPHTKLYQEERERPVVVMVDLGPTMCFGTRGAFKSVVGARAAALIGWAAVLNGDRIGALLFDGQHIEIPPRGGRRGVLHLIRRLAAMGSSKDHRTTEMTESGFNEVLQRSRRVVRPGSLVFILSDFYGIGETTGNHLLRLHQHNDILACQVVDPVEITPPVPGRYGVSDGRRTAVLDTTNRARREAYEDYFFTHQQSVGMLMSRHNIPLLRLQTTDDVTQRLVQGLATAFAGSKRYGTAA